MNTKSTGEHSLFTCLHKILWIMRYRLFLAPLNAAARIISADDRSTALQSRLLIALDWTPTNCGSRSMCIHHSTLRMVTPPPLQIRLFLLFTLLCSLRSFQFTTEKNKLVIFNVFHTLLFFVGGYHVLSLLWQFISFKFAREYLHDKFSFSTIPWDILYSFGNSW